MWRKALISTSPSLATALHRALDWPNVSQHRILNQHLIDAARLEGIRLGLEAAAKAALLNSHAEPFDLKYIDAVWSSIRALDPATIAKDAKPPA